MMITLMYIQRNIARYCGGYQGLLLTNQGMRYYARPQVELYIHHSEGHLPTLFLTVMDQLVKEKKPGLSVCQTYTGAAIHADDLRITVESEYAVRQQANVICNFAKTANLKLKASMLKVVKIWITIQGPREAEHRWCQNLNYSRC